MVYVLAYDLAYALVCILAHILVCDFLIGESSLNRATVTIIVLKSYFLSNNRHLNISLFCLCLTLDELMDLQKALQFHSSSSLDRLLP